MYRKHSGSDSVVLWACVYAQSLWQLAKVETTMKSAVSCPPLEQRMLSWADETRRKGR